MSCWVVPSIAAELWHVSLKHILSCVENGRLDSMKAAGFTFVDIAPAGAIVSADDARPRPRTYVPLDPDELAALADDSVASIAALAPPAPAIPDSSDPLPDIDIDALASPDPLDEPQRPWTGWHAPRAAARQLRRPPGSSRR